MLIENKIMFEIYRETNYSNEFRVVYFTELAEHTKIDEINRAMEAEHIFDGYIQSLKKERAKQRIENILKRLNTGEDIQLTIIEKELAEFLVK